MRGTLALFLALGLAACPEGQAPTEPTEPAAAGDIKAGRGVDLENKILRIGALDDESGPAAAIGKPYANGKKILAARINAGGSGLLPEGWKVELVSRDHGYNPQKSVQAYNEIKDQVLFIGTSFGTPNTLPLRPMLERDSLVAFPASLSSKMAEHELTPPIGTPYSLEARRAMDFAVEHAGGADKVKAGIIYQQDDYGADGLAGWTAQAKLHGVEVVSQQASAPGQKDFAAAITALKEAGATHVLLTTLPSATGPIVGTAAQLQYMPVWLGNTPSWVDAFFKPEVIPSAVFGKFHWVTGLPYWGEPSDGMTEFLAAYEKYGKELGPQDFYTLVSYGQGLVALEAFRQALEAGDVTPAGYKKALRSLKGFTAGGILQPLDLTRFPYMTSTVSRVLTPNFEKKSWNVVKDYGEAKAGEGAAAGDAPAPAAPAKEAAAK